MIPGDAYVPRAAFDELLLRVERLEKANPFNNASIDEGTGIRAGTNVFNPVGFQFIWAGDLRTVQSVAAGLNTKADNIAADVATKADGVWVQGQLSNLQSQINNSASSGAVSALSTELTNYIAAQAVRNATLQAQIGWILDNAVWKPTRVTDPPPPINQ